MKITISRWVTACALGGCVLMAACGDDAGHQSDVDVDASDIQVRDDAGRNDGGSTVADGGNHHDGGNDQVEAKPDGGTSSGGNNQNVGDAASGGASTGGDSDGGSGGGNSGDGDGGPQTEGDADGGQPGSECEVKAQDKCEKQKEYDPIGFALAWDGDMMQFCIPHRTAACEAGLPITAPAAISAACDTWAHASSRNYLNFHYKIKDSNGKWLEGDPACEAETTVKRGSKGAGADCQADIECKDGLFCKTDWDQVGNHADANDPPTDHETICGACTAQYAHAAETSFVLEANFCYRDEQCKTGYACVSPYAQMDNGNAVESLDDSYQYCMKISDFELAQQDQPCPPDSNIQCANGLFCDGGSCKPKVAMTDVLVHLNEPCKIEQTGDRPDNCDPREHLQCKSVTANGATSEKCFQLSVTSIGNQCESVSGEQTKLCSQYARCYQKSCQVLAAEDEECDPTSATPTLNDPANCQRQSFSNEKWLVCRQDAGETVPKCHEGTKQPLMCSLGQ